MRLTGTGAPADNNMSIFSNARRWIPLSSSAVSTTLRSAAGEAKIMVVSPAIAASASAVAVRVAGLVTDIFGVTDVAPIAGPNNAKGANPAKRLEPGATCKVDCNRWVSADNFWWVYRTPLAGPVEPEVNNTAASASGVGSGWSAFGVYRCPAYWVAKWYIEPLSPKSR